MTTKAQLASDLQLWLTRDAVGVDPLLSSVLRVAEARINRDTRGREQDVTIELEVTGRHTDLPDDLLRIRSLTNDADRDSGALEYYPPEALRKSNVWDNRGLLGRTAQGYSIEGDQLVIAPEPSADSPATLTLVYQGRWPSLIENETNQLLRNSYDIYLYACLAAGATQLEDTQFLGQYESAYLTAVGRYNMTENRARVPRTGLRVVQGSRRHIV